MKLNSFALGALTLATLATVARSQSGDPFDLSRSAIHGGGGTSSGSTGGAGAETTGNSQANHQFTLTGTIGQPDAGTAKLKGGQFSLAGGFWSYLNVVQTPGAPLLKIKLVGANAVLSWPLNT